MFRRARLLPLSIVASVIWLAIGEARQTAQPAGSPGQPVPETVVAATATAVPIREGLAVGLLGSYGRGAVPIDWLAWKLAIGEFREPREGDTIGPDDRNRSQTWVRVAAGDDLWIQHRALSGGHLFAVVTSARARTMILEASGYYVVRVNGEPRGGEKYGTDWVRHPVRLRAGRNTFLFQGERGRIRARLVEPAAAVFFTDSDATLPDLVAGLNGPLWAGIRLVNATEESIDRVDLAWTMAGQSGSTTVTAPVPPLTTRKLPISIAWRAAVTDGKVALSLSGKAKAGRRVVDVPPFEVALQSVAASAHHVRTFVSEADGSVQYYGVAPLIGGRTSSGGQKPALVLSLHGAGVEGIGQARAYKPKDWAYVVAPTNRRPYGFDWEDWGRFDALEVLADATRAFDADPARTYLTGHSMGGHGTWQIGVTVPDRWAAIAPSAGWHSFSSYGGGQTYKDPTPIERMLLRANHPSETTRLSRNYLHHGVYVLHGDKDDNVPVGQARAMRELLATFHPDFAYYERPGAGHWWGDECVDWPPLFEFLRQHTRAADAETTRVEFVTANPGISATSRWVTVLAQQRPLEYSRVVIDRDPKRGTFKGTTENVRRLALAPRGGEAGPVGVELDGTRLEIAPAPDGRLYLARADAGWQAAGPPDAALKGPHRSGGFKDAFRHRVVLVYGTAGTPDENARAWQKARFDAESFWYRGNGSFDVVPDTAFDPGAYRDRNVVLYGNADTNRAWAPLLGSSPVEMRLGRARVGERTLEGADLAAYFVRPRPDSATASVGAVSWSGPAGWVAAGPIQYFVSGAGFPDLLVLSADSLRRGTAGIRVLGWFGDDWRIETGDVAWAPAEAGTVR